MYDLEPLPREHQRHGHGKQLLQLTLVSNGDTPVDRALAPSDPGSFGKHSPSHTRE
jgi:hypothetical protein